MGSLRDKSIAMSLIRALYGPISALERIETPKDATEMLMLCKIKTFDCRRDQY